MAGTRNVLPAAAVAGIVAGPTFLTLATLLSFQERAGEVFSVSAAAIPASVLFLFLSSLFGTILAFPTCLIVGSAIGVIAAGWPIVRSPPLWLFAGGGLGVAIISAFGFGFGPESSAFVLTAIACAAIFRGRLDWD